MFVITQLQLTLFFVKKLTFIALGKLTLLLVFTIIIGFTP